jgi:hypothetical protein
VAAGTDLGDQRGARRGHVLAPGVRHGGEIRRGIPRHDRCEPAAPRRNPEGDEATQARAEESEAPVDRRMKGQVVEHGVEIGDTGTDGRVTVEST